MDCREISTFPRLAIIGHKDPVQHEDEYSYQGRMWCSLSLPVVTRRAPVLFVVRSAHTSGYHSGGQHRCCAPTAARSRALCKHLQLVSAARPDCCGRLDGTGRFDIVSRNCLRVSI